jgi:DnaK suppressor protein
MVASMTNERAKELLEQARDKTESELEHTRGDSNENVDDQRDPSSDADDLATRGTDDAVEETLTRRLEAIGRAEERLRAGTFGMSVASGEPIPDGRLEIEPWAELTVEEQGAL